MNLRALARDYANGVLGLQAYRKARDELIEKILTGHTKVTAHDFQPPLNTQRIEVEADITSIQTKPNNKNPVPTPSPPVTAPAPKAHQEHAALAHRGILVGIAAIIVLLVMIIIVALYPFTYQKKTAVDDARITSPDHAGAHPDRQLPDAVNAGTNLIKQFLLQNNWTDENLQQFLSAWQGLSAEERDNGLSSSARTELANAIYRKLDEERSMLGLGDAQSSINKQTVLVDFAQQMGINDPRFFVKDTP